MQLPWKNFRFCSFTVLQFSTANIKRSRRISCTHQHHARAYLFCSSSLSSGVPIICLWYCSVCEFTYNSKFSSSNVFKLLVVCVSLPLLGFVQKSWCTVSEGSWLEQEMEVGNDLIYYDIWNNDIPAHARPHFAAANIPAHVLPLLPLLFLRITSLCYL